MMTNVFLQVRQAKQQLEQPFPLTSLVTVRLAYQSLRGNVGVGQQPFQRVRVERLSLLAEFQSLSRAAKGPAQKVIQTERFGRQVRESLVATPRNSASLLGIGCHEHLPLFARN